MRCVVHSDDDFEPITVVEVNEFMESYLNEHGRVRVAVNEPAKAILGGPPNNTATIRFRTVDLIAIPIKTRKGNKHFVLVTADDESALLLKSAFLPGQRGAPQETEAAAYARGFLRAFLEFGPRRI